MARHGGTDGKGDDENEDDDEDDEEGECDVVVVVQAFDADSNAIANALFVYVLGYDEDNDLLDFGDEVQARTLPTWEYETDGPTCFVSCDRRRQHLRGQFCYSDMDLGWFDGIRVISITALPGTHSCERRFSRTHAGNRGLPQSSVHGELSIQWTSTAGLWTWAGLDRKVISAPARASWHSVLATHPRGQGDHLVRRHKVAPNAP